MLLLVIDLSIVAFSVHSVFTGDADFALGNVVGGTIFKYFSSSEWRPLASLW